MNGRRSILTVGGRDRSGRADRADSLRVRAVCELEPILRVGREACRFDLEGEVHVVAREGVARVDGAPGELSVVEDLERDADGNADIRRKGSANRDRTSPEQDGVVEGIAL